MIEADDVRVCGIHPLVAEEYEMHGIGKSIVQTKGGEWFDNLTQREWDAMYEQKCNHATFNLYDVCEKCGMTGLRWLEENGPRLKLEAEMQCAAEPTAEVSAAHNDVLNVLPAVGMEYKPMPMRAATEDDYFAEMARMREKIAKLESCKAVAEYAARYEGKPATMWDEFHRMKCLIAELSRRPTLEQYLRACEHVAELSALILKLPQTTAGTPHPHFPANALRHSV